MRIWRSYVNIYINGKRFWTPYFRVRVNWILPRMFFYAQTMMRSPSWQTPRRYRESGWAQPMTGCVQPLFRVCRMTGVTFHEEPMASYQSFKDCLCVFVLLFVLYPSFHIWLSLPESRAHLFRRKKKKKFVLLTGKAFISHISWEPACICMKLTDPIPL